MSELIALAKAVVVGEIPADGKRSTIRKWPAASARPGILDHMWKAMTMAEAANELTFLVTRRLRQTAGQSIRVRRSDWRHRGNTASSRSSRSRRFTFTDKRPESFWERIQERANMVFWANVNPKVSHSALESGHRTGAAYRQAGADPCFTTVMASRVAGLYEGMDGEKLYM